ncbi:NADP-dependent aldehyde dehydrogenase [Micromonospora viridifaciens]|uniref:NADP-dependent aldehyde dehydrogenase n=1 Tax=Micromonospora viridifaciens TaxID=1881 RepID=A0A1C4WZT9_MICVI|nr:aldehyde dehydrogenase (NADP(+)) [Micromonospora viridifaciens]SCF01725.1 NADP-dependent aldehyde dehydrogenase [Micromonospora viridifaciens]
MSITSTNPRTGTAKESGITNTSRDEVAQVCLRAAEAARACRRTSREQRAAFLREVASRLEQDRERLAATADDETALGLPRLTGEIGRTVFQLRAFADLVEEGSYLEVTIDSAADTAIGPRPELRRLLVPVGPVAVFGASNFPFAFSVCGGDTAAALAVGCPVIIKAHSSHPLTTQQTFDLLEQAAAATGMPAGVVGLVFGREAGQALVQDPHIKAVGFTGSEAGGRVLFDLASSRPEPIPFYGELGSINPLVVTPAAAQARAAAIAAGYVESLTLGGGQFCTKPSLMFIPANFGDTLRRHLAEEIAKANTPWLLNAGIHRAYEKGVADLEGDDGIPLLGRAEADLEAGFAVKPALFWTSAEQFCDKRQLMLTECFGPVGIVVEYASDSQLLQLLGDLPGALVGTIHAESADEALAADVVEVLSERVGRIAWNGYPTGVAVSWGMMHGGPYPSSTSLHTSVGQTSVRRFLRPLCYQAVPQQLLPHEARDNTRAVPLRRDGRLTLA